MLLPSMTSSVLSHEPRSKLILGRSGIILGVRGMLRKERMQGAVTMARIDIATPRGWMSTVGAHYQHYGPVFQILPA